jgi:DNA-binding NarL/FixJ family response regulator
MSARFWKSLFRAGRSRSAPTRTVNADEWSRAVRTLLDNLSAFEQRPQQEIHEDLLTTGLQRRHSSEGLVRHWNAFTPREQRVVALVCGGFTNPQIAVRLSVAISTVKTHIRHVLRKLGVENRADLRLLFAEWDFSDWQ